MIVICRPLRIPSGLDSALLFELLPELSDNVVGIEGVGEVSADGYEEIQAEPGAARLRSGGSTPGADSQE
jgi:hypothetical protein